MASTYFTLPAMLVIYVAQRAIELRESMAHPQLALSPKAKPSGNLHSVPNPA